MKGLTVLGVIITLALGIAIFTLGTGGLFAQSNNTISANQSIGTNTTGMQNATVSELSGSGEISGRGRG
jgi:hypothetical protein